MMKQIKLTQGLFALVDNRDFKFLNKFKWHASNESRGTKWYAVRFRTEGYAGKSKRVKVRMHRVVYERNNLLVPAGLVIDHLNHNSLDNRNRNLEAVSQAENMKRSPGWKRKSEKS